jgi:hypothetical protein
MKIGIIGAGHIGGALTHRLTELGHEVRVANSRGPGTLAALAAETGAKAVTAREAVRGAELVIVTIPEKNVPTRPRRSCCASWTSSASTLWTPVAWTSPGGNSRAPRSTRRISTPPGCGRH